jgi:hypothetical protein
MGAEHLSGAWPTRVLTEFWCLLLLRLNRLGMNVQNMLCLLPRLLMPV